jgi:hypothetical protein
MPDPHAPDVRRWSAPLAALLEQGAELAGRLAPETFACSSPLAPGGGIGSHLRHVGDFVQALLRDLDAGRVDYDRRERDERLERDPARARLRLAALSRALQRLAGRDPETALCVRAEECLVPDSWQASTLARELGALFSHTLHHYALVAVLLRAQGLEPPAGLGVAPSTLAHWREPRSPCAPPAG